MKRTKGTVEERNKSTELTLTEANDLAGTLVHKDYGLEKWDHSYCDRIAWKMIRANTEWLVCYARFILLFVRRKLRVDSLVELEQVARYYMARAQVRLSKEA